MKRLLLDSRFATLNNDGSYTFNLYESIVISKFRLLFSQLPNAYYTVNTLNQWLDIQINNGGVTNTYAIQIPVGNYTTSTLSTYILGQLNTLYPGGNYTMTYDNAKYAFVITSTYRLRFLFKTGTHTQNCCYYILGFSKTDTSLAYSLTSDQIPDLNSPNYILVYVDKVDQQIQNNCSIYDNKATFVIPLTVGKGQIQTHMEYLTFEQSSSFKPTAYTQLNVMMYTIPIENVTANEDVYIVRSPFVLLIEIN